MPCWSAASLGRWHLCDQLIRDRSMRYLPIHAAGMHFGMRTLLPQLHARSLCWRTAETCVRVEATHANVLCGCPPCCVGASRHEHRVDRGIQS